MKFIFETGKPIDMDALSPEELTMLFGAPIAERILARRAEWGRPQKPGPRLKVLAMDREAGTVTIGLDEEGAEP